MNAKHTPTPWCVIPNGTRDIAAFNVVSGDAPGERVILAKFVSHFTRGQATADAAHIVRCVNAHDELIAALRKIDQAWPAHGSATDNAIADAMAQVARAALAKVESTGETKR